jgi:dTDP-4-dehydrorhamnose reductase
MKVLVLGCKGQLGLCLADQLKNSIHKVIYTSRDQIDISNLLETSIIVKGIKPDVIINASAYTEVDKAESEKVEANIINHLAVSNIADTARKLNSLLIHVSTDYVFNGSSNKPYKENNKTSPQGVYGKTKLKGELAIAKSGCNFIIIRTSWLFSEYGSNFLKTILNLGMERKELSVICDQIGSPTYTQDLAKAIIASFSGVRSGASINKIFHYSGNNQCSWFEFTQEIFIAAKDCGFKIKANLNKISSSEYKTNAKRPMYSVLDSSLFYKTFQIKPSNWKRGIKESLDVLIKEVN